MVEEATSRGGVGVVSLDPDRGIDASAKGNLMFLNWMLSLRLLMDSWEGVKMAVCQIFCDSKKLVVRIRE